MNIKPLTEPVVLGACADVLLCTEEAFVLLDEFGALIVVERDGIDPSDLEKIHE